MKRIALRYASSGALVALIVLCLAWELRLAPLRPGGSWLAMKALPLVFPLVGILRGRVYTYQWASALALIYGAEGLVRWWSESGIASGLALIEFFFATIFTVSAAFYVRQHQTVT